MHLNNKNKRSFLCQVGRTFAVARDPRTPDHADTMCQRVRPSGKKRTLSI